MSDVPELDRLLDEAENVRRNRQCDRREQRARLMLICMIFDMLVLLPMIWLLGETGIVLWLALFCVSLLPVLVGHVFEFLIWLLTPPKPRDPTKRYISK